MGTPDFSVPTLETLIQSKHEVVAVVTQPDKPKGRGKKLVETPVKAVALAHNIKVYQPKKVKEDKFIDTLKEINPDVIVVIAFGQILSKAILELPKYGCINIHASLLPHLRGAAPLQWAVINGDKKTGITTMQMDVGLDTGDMILKEEVQMDEKETFGSLHDKLSVLGGPLLLETLEQIEKNTIVRIKQDDSLSSYAKMIEKSLGHINWHEKAVVIERLIRGLNPWPSAFTYLEGKMMKLWEAKVVSLADSLYEPGTICEINKEGFVVKCGENGLLITELQLQGKKRMDTPSFLRGVEIIEGSKLK
jgi:methionyl-tRNA formyltransferase